MHNSAGCRGCARRGARPARVWLPTTRRCRSCACPACGGRRRMRGNRHRARCARPAKVTGVCAGQDSQRDPWRERGDEPEPAILGRRGDRRREAAGPSVRTGQIAVPASDSDCACCRCRSTAQGCLKPRHAGIYGVLDRRREAHGYASFVQMLLEQLSRGARLGVVVHA